MIGSDSGIPNTFIEQPSSIYDFENQKKFERKTFSEVELRMRLSDLQCIRWLRWPDI